MVQSNIIANGYKSSQQSAEHYLYVHLIDFLSPLYPTVDIDKLQSLAISSYKYFRFLLSFDEFVDSNNDDLKNQFPKLLNLKNGLKYLEESICLLANLFPSGSTFWKYFNDYKEVYFETIVLEKKLSFAKTPIDTILFEKIAKGKSAICINAIYAIQTLGSDTQYENDLIEIINEIHIGLQLIDDIDDFQKDIHEKQWTYPQSLLQDYLVKNGIEEIDTKLKHKYLYLSSIAEDNLQTAALHFENAHSRASKLQLNELSNYIKTQIKKVDFHCQEIQFLLEKARIKAQKSTIFIESNTLEKSIVSGIHYLTTNIGEGHTWSDFMTSAGAGKAWITGFVGMNLAEIDNKLPVLKKVAANIVENPTDFLSYNQSIFQDGDSTSFLVGFLEKMQLSNIEIETSWYRFFDDDGGWVTYRNADELRERLELPEEISVDGWLSSKLCVSAVACYVLSFFEGNSYYDRSATYLIKNIENSHWESYWWTSDVYATAYSILALCSSEKCREHCAKPIGVLTKQQDEHGFWVNPMDNQPNAFYTSLALKALIVYDRVFFQTHIQKGIDWLLRTQTQDGSWQTNRILQIPATDVEDPKSVSKWRNSSFGVNCVTDDHTRVFTTSAVVNCLATFKQLSKC